MFKGQRLMKSMKPEMDDDMYEDMDDEMDEEMERSMGAGEFIRNQFKGFKPSDAKGYKNKREFISAMKDVLTEGDIYEMYPSSVWEPQADKFFTELWAKHSSKMQTAKKPVKGSSRGSRIQMR